jgi:5,10-methylenetetrahydromethanopterin reductase
MLLDLPRFGVRLSQALEPQRCIELAVAAEVNGFASLWFAENPFHRGVVPIVGACAVKTSRIALGLGIVNFYQHHPSLTAAEFAALDELASGRARLGIGCGVGPRIQRLGYDWKPLASLRDALAIVRPLLQGENVHYRGSVFSAEGVTLGFRPPRPDAPIYVASMGDRSLELCGRHADGLIISNMCPPRYTERAVAIVQNSAAKAGREPLDIVQYVPCVIRCDRQEARRLAKATIGAMLTTFWPTDEDWPAIRDTIVACSGIAKRDVASALARLRRGEPADAVLDDRYVAAFAIAGTTEDCLDQAAEYRRAGTAELVLTFAGPQPEADMAAFAAQQAFDAREGRRVVGTAEAKNQSPEIPAPDAPHRSASTGPD